MTYNHSCLPDSVTGGSTDECRVVFIHSLQRARDIAGEMICCPLCFTPPQEHRVTLSLSPRAHDLRNQELVPRSSSIISRAHQTPRDNRCCAKSNPLDALSPAQSLALMISFFLYAYIHARVRPTRFFFPPLQERQVVGKPASARLLC